MPCLHMANDQLISVFHVGPDGRQTAGLVTPFPRQGLPSHIPVMPPVNSSKILQKRHENVCLRHDSVSGVPE